jgi:hypothetical protein
MTEWKHKAFHREGIRVERRSKVSVDPADLRRLADNPWAEYLPDVHKAMHAAADEIQRLRDLHYERTKLTDRVIHERDAAHAVVEAAKVVAGGRGIQDGRRDMLLMLIIDGPERKQLMDALASYDKLRGGDGHD